MGSMFKRATLTVTREGEEKIIEIPLEGSQDMKAIELFKRASKETGLPQSNILIVKKTPEGEDVHVKRTDKIEPGMQYYMVSRHREGGGVVPPSVKRKLLRQIDYLQKVYNLNIVFHPEMRWIMVYIDLPEKGIWKNKKGDVIKAIPVLIDVPPDFPRTIPGVGFSHPRYAIHIPFLTCNGKPLKELHECSPWGCNKTKKGWYWLCFQEIHGVECLISLIRVIEDSILKRAGFVKNGG